jgi:NitT/TauT family transport system substrate-binding protein
MMSSFTLKWFVRLPRAATLAGAALGLAALMTSATAADKFEVRFSWTPTPGQMPLWLGLDKGWYKEKGLDVKFEDGKGSTLTVNLVGAGKFDVGYANVGSMTIGRDKAGMKLKALMIVHPKSEIALMVDKKSGVTKLEQLAGKGWDITYTPGSFEGPFMDAFFFNQGGLKRSDVNLKSVGFTEKINLYITSRVHGFVSSAPFNAPLMRKERPSNYILMADYGLVIPSHGVMAHEDKIAAKRDQMRAFVQVTSRAWAYTLDNHHDEAVKAVQNQRPQDKSTNYSLLREQWLEYKGGGYHINPMAQGKKTPFGYMPQAYWEGTLKTFKAAGVVKPGSDPRDFYTNEFLEGTS